MTQIVGTVLEYYTKRPIQGAIIAVDGLTAITNHEGKFNILSAPSGSITLRIHHPEFEYHTVSLTAYKAPLNLGVILLKPIFKPLR
jgi:hypothetical protein